MPCGRYELDLCALVLEDHFGPTVSRVGIKVLRERLALAVIAQQLSHPVETRIPLKRIKRALAILEHHNLLNIKQDASFRVTYSLDPQSVLDIMAFPRACFTAKTMYGTAAEVICEELALTGRAHCSEIIRRVRERIGIPGEEVKKKFIMLAESQFLIRLAPVECRIRGAPKLAEAWERFTMPDVIAPIRDATNYEIEQAEAMENEDEDIKPDLAALKAAMRKRKANGKEAQNPQQPKEDPDVKVVWRLNMIKFRRYFRDRLVLELVCGKAEVAAPPTDLPSTTRNVVYAMRALVRLAEKKSPNPCALSTPPITLMEIMNEAKHNHLPIEKRDMEWAFETIVEESHGIVRKVGDSGGGLLVLDFERAIAQAVEVHVDSLLREQIDSKAIRIRRLLEKRGYLEEDSIDKAVMLSPKQTRDLLYKMAEESYVFIKSFGKTTDMAPARTICLYHVDTPQTVRCIVETTTQMLRNLIARRLFLEKENAPLLERQTKMEVITFTMSEEELEQQRQEIEDLYMPPSVKKGLEEFKKSLVLLNSSEVEVESVLFTLKLFLEHASKRMPQK